MNSFFADLMAKKGRPKDINKAQNRRQSIVFTVRAERIRRHLEAKMGTRWQNAYFSQKLCEDFPLDNDLEFWLKEQLRRAKAMHEAQDHWQESIDKIKEIKKRKEGKGHEN